MGRFCLFEEVSVKKMAVVLLLIGTASVFAQEEAVHIESAQTETVKHRDFWVCPGAETAMFSPTGMAYGGGLSIGYGRRATIGFKAAYLVNTKGLSTLELNFLFRWYFLRPMAYFGPFVQIGGGPVFFAQNKNTIAVPAEFGTVSASLSVGWRFLLGKRWFLEPAIRAGYPFLVGAGVSAGLRF